jgi:hypothetical protein
MKRILMVLTALVITAACTVMVKAQTPSAETFCDRHPNDARCKAPVEEPRRTQSQPSTGTEYKAPTSRVVTVGGDDSESSSASPFDNPDNAETVRAIRRLVSDDAKESDVTVKVSFSGQKIRFTYDNNESVSISLSNAPFRVLRTKSNTYAVVYGDSVRSGMIFLGASTARSFVDLINSLTR